MKKRLLIAALAATMSVVATADISITGDAYVSFASQKVRQDASGNTNNDNQRARIKVVGSAGDTEVVAVIRNGSQTRVDWTPRETRRIDVKKGIHMDSLYLTTKIGPVDIKAGDYWGTIGLGAHSMEAAKKNAISISTKVTNNWKVGLFTANGSADNGSDSTNVNVSGKIGPVEVSAVHNPDDFTDISAKATFGNIFVAAEQWDDKTTTNNDTTLIHIGGKVGGFKWDVVQIEHDRDAVFAKEVNLGTEDNPEVYSMVSYPEGELMVLQEDPNNAGVYIGDTNENIIHIKENPSEHYIGHYNNGELERLLLDGAYKTIEDITHSHGPFFTKTGRARLVLDDSYFDDHATGKLAPLGSMLIGRSARGTTATAVIDDDRLTKIFGVAVSTEVAGNTVKAIYTKSTMLIGLDDIIGKELIVSRPLSNGVILTANIGKISGMSANGMMLYTNVIRNTTNTGIRLDVKF